MRLLFIVFRTLASISMIVISLLGWMIVFSGREGLLISEYMLFIGISFFTGAIGISGLLFKDITSRSWLKWTLSCLLLIGVLMFTSMAFESGFSFKHFITALYMGFLAIINLWFLFSKNQNPTSQTVWVAMFIFFTAIQISFGTMANLVHASLFFIVLLLIAVLVVTPYYVRKKLELLFTGQHEALSRQLHPKLMIYDAVIEAYSAQYSGHIEKSQELLEKVEKRIYKSANPPMQFQYMCHAIAIENGYYLNNPRGLEDRFEKMKALNKKLYKKGYPMATTYKVMYLLGLYANKAHFEQELEAVTAFEEAYHFKGQSGSFYKHLKNEQALFDAAVAILRQEKPASLEQLEKELVQPIHKMQLDTLKNQISLSTA